MGVSRNKCSRSRMEASYSSDPLKTLRKGVTQPSKWAIQGLSNSYGVDAAKPCGWATAGY
eukprot:1159447-Pelagomonas_calceolata.AAC.2